MNLKKMSWNIVITIFISFLMTAFDSTAGQRGNEYRSKKLASNNRTTSIRCPSDKFECGNGKCLEANKVCNNHNDCDIDEDAQHCSKFFLKQQGSSESCFLPSEATHLTFPMYCPRTANCSYQAGKPAPLFTQILISCKTGYKFKEGRTIKSSCIQGTWSPPIPECYRTCPPIKDPDMDLTCQQDSRGVSIPCDDAFLEGAIVYPKCKEYYQPDRPPDYPFIQCQSNGQWDRQLFKCIAVCGRALKSRQALIKEGKPEQPEDSPWHVAVYDKSNPDEPDLICGGTIITSKIIVSAAHCFYNYTGKTYYSSSLYEIVVAKYTLDYTVKDNSETKIYKIRKILTPEALPFRGDVTHYVGDIALIWTIERIEFSSGVLPACVEWTALTRFESPEGIEGKLVGWGYTENGTSSTILRTALLPYVSYKNCSQLVNPDFIIGADKFCAGTLKGAGARPGDSGGGLLYRNMNTYGNLYYLRGVVSNKDATTGEKQTSLAAFTDVAQYTNWIYRKRTEIENAELLAENKDVIKTSTESTPQSRCPVDKFECSNGSCIDKKLLCNGVNDCPDGKDERNETCQNNEEQRENKENCLIPSESWDQTFTVQCPSTADCSHKSGERVPTFTIIKVDCKALNQFGTKNTSESVSVCIRGTWQPPISKCSGKCAPIRDPDLDLVCIQKQRTVTIPCDDAMPVGAIIQPKCKNYYHQDKDVDYSYIQCQANSRWDQDLFKCIPDCGRVPGKTLALMKGGKPDKRGDSPWNVAIYEVSDRNRPELICGGTIIAPQIIVTAAHCFYDEPFQRFRNVSLYEVGVAKYTRDYKTIDYKQSKLYKIRKIITPEEIKFTGFLTDYVGDIALLWMREKIAFSNEVLPACVDWTSTTSFVAPNGTKGKMVGWGLTENYVTSPILLETSLPYITLKNCREMVDEDYIIGADKFCAGTKSTGPNAGDSGAGLLFRNMDTYGNLYYIRGIASNASPIRGERDKNIGAFTDVAQYAAWINEKRTEIEKEELLAESKIGLKM